MQLTPRYDGPPVLSVRGDHLPDPVALLLGQRRRLADALASLPVDGWAAPSRCAEWAVRDVVAHLVDVDRFWAFSIGMGRAGTPSTFLATFDPVTSPPALVAAHAEASPAELLAAFAAGIDGLATALDGLDVDGPDPEATGLDVLAEAPPGHIPIRALVLHALWDGWVHERDVLVPLGRTPVEDPDEVAAALLYVAALGPAFAACAGSTRAGALVVDATDPDVRIVVALGPSVTAALEDGDDTAPPDAADAPSDAVVLRGPAVALVEGLSLRAPLPSPVAPDDRWALGTLDVVFDQPPA